MGIEEDMKVVASLSDVSVPVMSSMGMARLQASEGYLVFWYTMMQWDELHHIPARSCQCPRCE